ncbi:MAG: hypothetical protein ABTQ34_04945 [Bdellovibrionales bacterium]
MRNNKRIIGDAEAHDIFTYLGLSPDGEDRYLKEMEEEAERHNLICFRAREGTKTDKLKGLFREAANILASRPQILGVCSLLFKEQGEEMASLLLAASVIASSDILKVTRNSMPHRTYVATGTMPPYCAEKFEKKNRALLQFQIAAVVNIGSTIEFGNISHVAAMKFLAIKKICQETNWFDGSARDNAGERSAKLSRYWQVVGLQEHVVLNRLVEEMKHGIGPQLRMAVAQLSAKQQVQRHKKTTPQWLTTLREQWQAQKQEPQSAPRQSLKIKIRPSTASGHTARKDPQGP